MRASHRGVVELHFTSDEGLQVNLRLMRVLYVKGLQTRLFSIESFVSDGHCSALYSKGKVKLGLPNNVSMTIDLPHIPAGTYLTSEVKDINDLNGRESGLPTWIHNGPRESSDYLELGN